MTPRIKIFLAAFFLSLPAWWLANMSQKYLEGFFYAQIGRPFQEMAFVKIPNKNSEPKLELQAKAALSVKIKENGREITLFRKNPEAILPIASLSKLMTALVVWENPEDYDFYRVVEISNEAASQDDVPIYGNLKAGENFTAKKLLDLMLVYSSNDAAWALSEVLGKDNFVAKMNAKAKELGLDQTNFANPTGLDPENLHFEPSTQDYFNYSTPRDLFSLAKYILADYPEIFETSSSKGPYPTQNGISGIVSPGKFVIFGGKTGNTDEAGAGMLLVLLSQNKEPVINLILGAPSPEQRVGEMQKLIDSL